MACTINDLQSLDPLRLTYVLFTREDKIGQLLAYITLGPFAILVAYASVIVSRREIAAINMLLGQLLCEGLNTILKESLQVSRPCEHLGDGYGMPSSHSQFIAYFTTYLIIYTYAQIKLDHSIWKHLLAFAAIVVAVLVCYSRVYLHYHTVNQVLIGSSVGVLFAIIWYITVEKVLYPFGFFTWILQLPLARFVYLRDSRCLKNVAKWEYQNWVQFEKTHKTKKIT